ncbi:MAG TPA: HEAT repeat domain-containing protein [Gemmataceae bacterium]|jgi:HEAT repeat protein|nr:HEAT repeat domain-containing protein [Gemmataceae bacterium]
MKKLIGFLALAACLGFVSLAEANKEEDAIKYTKMLKTAKSVQDKMEAARELGNIGQINKKYVKDAIPLLIECCKDKKNADLRAVAAEALGKADPAADTGAVELLTDLVKNDSEMKVKQAAARGLGAMGSSAKDALPVLRDTAKNVDKKDARPFRDAAMAIQGTKK